MRAHASTLKVESMNIKFKSRIPLWVNIMQAVLIMIMAQQVVEYFFGHGGLVDAGIAVEGDPQLNLIYEMGSRLGVMVAASVFVMVTQNPRQYLVVLFMNVVREGTEMFVDPLWPVADAPFSPTVDFLIHVVIVAIEVAAFVSVLKIIRQADNAEVEPA